MTDFGTNEKCPESVLTINVFWDNYLCRFPYNSRVLKLGRKDFQHSISMG